MRDVRARGETEGGGRQIGSVRDPTAATIEGPRPETEDGGTTGGIGHPLERGEIEGTGTAEIGRLAPTEDPAVKETEDNASRTADEKNEDRKGLT